MSRSITYQIRLPEDLKKQSFELFENLGITPAQAIKMFLQKAVNTQSLPIDLEYTPNEQTAKILLKPYEEQGFKRFSSVEDLMADLND